MNAHAIAENNEDDSVKELNADIDELRQKKIYLVLEDMTAKILNATGNSVLATASPLADEEILEEVIIEKIEADDDLDEELDEEVAIPNVREVEGALEILHKFFVFSEKKGRVCNNFKISYI